MRAQLNLARRRTNAADLTKVGISHIVIRIAIAGNIEEIEEIGAKSDRLRLRNVEVLKGRSIDL